MELFDRNEKFIAHYSHTRANGIFMILPHSVKLEGLPKPGTGSGRANGYSFTPEEFEQLKELNNLMTENDLKQPSIFDFMMHHT
ncbi:hypothetical protein ERX35_007965 [Macrococcus equipercicus]|uniref:Uncharacterized protein n=1 Tax=Macrococcus equipercicus TaxID=69967 RepID=A0ABQ6R7S5_9STAP|nr:hypothetical protein [Macrococcus equipercicus]KAA1039141.1 hypothetical protein ERX35_007965 [Macrococcus equipercicus]